MKKLALLSLTSIGLAIGVFAGIKSTNDSKEVRDASIIVKMKDDVNKHSQMHLLGQQNSLLREISNNITTNYKVVDRYSHVFNGFTLEVPAAYVSRIRSLNRVDKVNYEVEIIHETLNDGVDYALPKTIVTSTASSQTMSKPEGTNDGAGTFIAILDNGFYIKEDGTHHNVFSELSNPADAVVTQASLKAKIDAAGDKFHGKYDATHTTYYNNKVPFYYDYGGDKQGGVNPDFDVYAEGQDHGTHVASIAGGNAGSEYEGIAPRSQMALMKVFTTYMSGQTYQSGAYNTAILNALEDCLVLGVDSINMSLGNNLNDFDDGEIVEDVIRELESKGTFVCVAAGNDGKGQYSNSAYANWSMDMVETGILSSYANNLASMTVASTQADYQFYGEALTIDGTNVQFSDQVTNYKSTSGDVTYTPERHLVDVVNKVSGEEKDFVYLPGVGAISEYEGLDVTGKIVVTNRGDLTFREKVDNAVSKGAIAVLIIDNTTATDFSIRMSFAKDTDTEPYTPEVPVAFILKRDQSIFADSVSKKCKFLIDVDLDNPNGRIISDYSSDGMRYDLAIKPEIATPGENIKGAVLGAVDKYESMSGTSMATPNFCGTTALMVGEHLGDADYRKTINARLMSTAQPMKDLGEGKTYTSVRRQGAGLVNIENAINSQVYLDGLDAEGKQLGKAKIELFNNDDIKQGKVKLSFAAINESGAPITYTATTYVLAPKTTQYEDERYPEITGKQLTIEDRLVATFSDSVDIAAGTSTINLPEHALTDEQLASLDAEFEAGCILEGYVILTAESKAQLSIPFLGYYGDLSAVSPVEPFNFEREEGKLYGSDILNELLTKGIGKTENADYTHADYSSQIVTGYWSSMSNVSMTNVLKNTTSLSKMSDDNGQKVKFVGQNPYNGEMSKDTLFVGNNGYANAFIIQQYVNRSVADNTLTLTNKATGKVVLTDHMFDSLIGEENGKYPLYKSHFDSALYDNGYMAHRAYTIIPLMDTKSGKDYPDGEYEMKFSFQLAAGSTFEMSYTLTIDSEMPVLKRIEKTENAYRFHYSATNTAVLFVNNKAYQAVKEDGGAYCDVPLTDIGSNDKAFIKAQTFAFGEETFLTHLNDEKGFMLYNKLFNKSYDFTYTSEEKSAGNTVYTFEFKEGSGKGAVSGYITYRMLKPADYDSAKFKVFSIDDTGKEREVTVKEVGDYLQFSATTKTIRIQTGEEAPAPDPTPSGNKNSGLLIAGIILTVVFFPVGIILLLIYFFGK